LATPGGEKRAAICPSGLKKKRGLESITGKTGALRKSGGGGGKDPEGKGGMVYCQTRGNQGEGAEKTQPWGGGKEKDLEGIFPGLRLWGGKEGKNVPGNGNCAKKKR